MTKAGTFNFIRFDYRSVGIFQLLLGISLLYNLIIRFSYAVELYGSSSIIPFDVFKKMNGPASYSIFNLIRNDFFSQAFILVAMLLCLGYIFGRYYKVFAIALTFFYWNLLQGSSAFVFGFEFFTFQLLFWSCFLPVGYRPWNGKSFTYTQPNFTICLVLTIQIVWVYFATGIVKYGESWDGGYAVRNMAADQLATWGIAGFLFSTPWAYTLFTYLTLFFEYTFPLWVLMPYKNHYFRLVVVAFLLAFHTGIFFSYHVANFSISGVAVAFLLVPTWLWDKVKLSRLTKTNDAIKLPLWQMVFCVFAIYVISIKSIIFTVKYGEGKKSKKTEQLLSKLAIIDFPKLVKVSFFTQHWKMFAPNPPVKCGWLALEELKDNGDIYDCATGKKVEEKPERFWHPKGFEYYMMMFTRTYDFPDGSGDKFKVFLKYWIPYKLKKLGLEKVDIKNIFLTDYLYIIANQKDISKVPVKRNITGALKFINQSFPVLEAEPIN